jgi:hypothetical protein
MKTKNAINEGYNQAIVPSENKPVPAESDSVLEAVTKN